MRRALIVVLLIAIVAAIGWWLWHMRTGAVRSADPWKALPTNAAVVLEVPDPLATWQRFTSTAQAWRDLEKVPSCAALNALFERMVEAAANDAALQRALGAHALLLAWERQGEAPGMLALWPVDAAPHLLTPLGTALGADLTPSSTLWMDGRLTVRTDSLLPPLELAWKNGLLLASDHAAMLDDALRRLSGPQAPVDTLLLRARATLGGGSDAHLLVQPARAARLLAPWIEQEAPPMPEGWAALDLRSRPGSLLMSGLLFTTSAAPGLAAMDHQTAGRPSLLRVLPASVTRLRTAHVTDPARFAQDLLGHPPDEVLFTAYGSWVNGGIGVAEARAPGDSLTHRWCVLQAADPAQAAAALIARCEGGCDTTSYRSQRVARMADAGALGAVFGGMFAPFDRPLWTLLSDKVVFAGTPADMRAVIDAWTDGTSLAVDPRSGEFFRQYASDAAFTWWVDVVGTFPTWRASARPEAVQAAERLRAAWSGFGGCLLELTSQRPGVHEVTFCLQHLSSTEQDGGALWSAAIGAPLEGPVFLLKDHLSRTLQVLVQDRDHRLSLISCTGKVLWQRELDGPILGEVRQVDRFKNGKLQMLLATADQLYLIDRNGKDVEDFPVRPPAAIGALPAVLDYDGTRDYRVLVPLKDGRLLNLGMDGKPVQGWAPPPLDAPALAPVEHVRLKGKDFLVAVDDQGGVRVMDRRGEKRYDPKLRLTGISAFLGLRTAMDIGTCRLLWSDSSGAVLSGTLDGTVDTLARPGRGKAIAFGGSGGIGVARVTSDSLVITDAKGGHTGASVPDDGGAMLFPVPIGQEEAIGLVLPARDQVRLFGSDGSRWTSTPLTGSVCFRVADINLDGVLELVTATKDGRVVAYALPAQPQ